MIEKNTSFPLLLEQRVSKLSANINLPEPQSGEFFFRLVRLPVEGVETVVDVYSRGYRLFIRLSRMLSSLRKLEIDSDADYEEPCLNRVPVEISVGPCDPTEPIVREIRRGSPFELESRLLDEPEEAHYFVFHTDSKDCVARAISSPHGSGGCELWTRLICYSYGAEQNPPRRFFRRDLLVSQ